MNGMSYTTAMRRISLIALICALTVLQTQAGGVGLKTVNSGVSDGNCPLGISIIAKEHDNAFCRADRFEEKSLRTLTGSLLGAPLGAAGFVIGAFAVCPAMDVYALSKKASGDAGMAVGFFIALCPDLLAGKFYDVGSAVSAGSLYCRQAWILGLPPIGAIVASENRDGRQGEINF
ncbi:MAG: hypothetical protein HKL90_16730 [Elusimicrobia bacterium]|nr:hypothetical protein [Elusimicrobiota bacterium]